MNLSRVLAPLLCGLAIAACTTTEEELKGNRVAGAQIVAAVARFEWDSGAPPNTLTELIPDYLQQIPSTIAGDEFIYVPADKTAYGDWSLTFQNSDRSGCTYIYHFQAWDCWPAIAGD